MCVFFFCNTKVQSRRKIEGSAGKKSSWSIAELLVGSQTAKSKVGSN